MQLKLSTRSVGNVLVVDCNGRVVFGEEAAALRETVKGALAQNKNIVLNLKNVTYIDSGGLGTLVGLFTSAQHNQGHIKLASLAPRVDQLLQVTKLATVFELYNSEEDAITSFAKSATA